jgi:hypothetical protein
MTEQTVHPLEQAIADLGVTMAVEFVPWSKSRHAKPNPKLDDRSLNWRVTLRTKEGREIITTDYSAGIGHCPSYKQGARLTLEYAEKIAHETEVGKQALSSHRFGSKIEPKLADVVYSLVSDASAIDYATFEEWAGDVGYDTDSRKGEQVYRACLEIGLKLRAMLGEPALTRLREASQDY